jgi:hypothetical protein
MEKIQGRALRFVYQDYLSSYELLLLRGNHSMLYINRLRSMAVEVFKALNDYSPEYIKDMFEIKDINYNLRTAVSLKQPKYNSITHGFNSFRYKGTKIWNDLPHEIKSCLSLKEFIEMIKKWQGPKCLCVMCERLL